MITKTFENFNIKQIADSGQCFRMTPAAAGDGGAEEAVYTVISGPRCLTVSQSGQDVTFFCEEAEFPFWEHYFDLDTDYGAMIRSIDRSDTYLKNAASAGNGIRILRQDLWEMIITFIISQQKTIPAIRSLVETLCQTYGEKKKIPAGNPRTGFYYTFPTPSELNEASLEDLLSLKLGYRAKYIKKICEDACSGALDLDYLKTLDYTEAMVCLQRFYGIGEKVANCICLFGLHHIDAFPVDTWIRKILLREYAPKSRCTKAVPQTKLCDALIKENFSRYKGYAGVMQQYIFYYERLISAA